MRINFDRLSKLAGIPATANRRGLYEGKDHEQDEDMTYEGTALEGLDEDDEMDELHASIDEDDEMAAERDSMETLDEMIEIDEVMLVQELRRAKRIMSENKRRRLSESRRSASFERELKQVIDEEVQSIMAEMNLNAQWVYGDNAPRRSRKGYTHQGSILPGLGFRR